MNLYDISYFLLCFIYDIYVYTCPTLANVTSVLNTSFSYTHNYIMFLKSRDILYDLRHIRCQGQPLCERSLR